MVPPMCTLRVCVDDTRTDTHEDIFIFLHVCPCRVRVMYLKHFDKTKRDDESGREVYLQSEVKKLKASGNDEPKWTSRGVGKLMITVRSQ